MSNKPINELENLARLFIGRARSHDKTSREKFLAELNLSVWKLNKTFPKGKWRELQDEWALERASRALDEVYCTAAARERFSIKEILKRLRGTGIGKPKFMRLAGDEWRQRRTNLPTAREKVLTVIKDLVAERIPTRELTIELIFKKAGVSPKHGPWFYDALLSARQELLDHQTDKGCSQPPEGIRALALASGWIDVDADVWDMRSECNVCLKRNALRSDIADIAWPLMRDALLDENLSCSTICTHFRGYRCVGELLGNEVPNVREATLEQVQKAWLKYDSSTSKRDLARAALKRIFTHLCNPEIGASGAAVKEMLIISGWLYTSVTILSDSPDQDFLSDAEMNAVIAGCLSDIKAGLDFTESEPDLLGLFTRPRAGDTAAPVVQWASSLMILVMLFVGLRARSAAYLKVGDWEELRPSLFGLIWSHGKKREEKVAILATSLALLLSQYVERTLIIRKALRTENVFLYSNKSSYWCATLRPGYLNECIFSAFVKRHGLRRSGIPLKLNSQILRRTYVTRELYMGRSIWALQLQLGHESIRTTRQYGKFDLFEHPAEVGCALDTYARGALELWHHPLLLVELDPAKRDRLLGVKEERHQNVGLCRSDCCQKLLSGSPPPCSLCEHLVTGPEFLGAWDIEQKKREGEMERLRSMPDARHLLEQRKFQYETFCRNLAYVKGEKRS
jgi:integrase